MHYYYTHMKKQFYLDLRAFTQSGKQTVEKIKIQFLIEVFKKQNNIY